MAPFPSLTGTLLAAHHTARHPPSFSERRPVVSQSAMLSKRTLVRDGPPSRAVNTPQAVAPLLPSTWYPVKQPEEGRLSSPPYSSLSLPHTQILSGDVLFSSAAAELVGRKAGCSPAFLHPRYMPPVTQTEFKL